VFNEKLGNKIEYGILVGRSMSGKTELGSYLKNNFDYRVIDMKVVSDKIKTKLGTEDEPFEGEVPLA